jgi:hypothetical protein
VKQIKHITVDTPYSGPHDDDYNDVDDDDDDIEVLKHWEPRREKSFMNSTLKI